MTNNDQNSKRIYRTIDEIERVYFRRATDKEKEEVATTDPVAYGAQVAREMIEAMRREVIQHKDK